MQDYNTLLSGKSSAGRRKAEGLPEPDEGGRVHSSWRRSLRSPRVTSTLSCGVEEGGKMLTSVEIAAVPARRCRQWTAPGAKPER